MGYALKWCLTMAVKISLLRLAEDRQIYHLFLICPAWQINACMFNFLAYVAKLSVTLPIVNNMPTRELLAGETKNSFL